MPVQIRELAPTEMGQLFPLILQSNPHLTEPRFAELLAAMLPSGYRAIGAFDGVKLVGCSGFWIFTRFWCERQLDIDNFVVDASYRGGGVGTAMVQWLEAKAAEEHCALIVLDNYVSAAPAQQFYFKQGFALTGFHFTKMPGSKVIGSLPNERRV